MVHVVHATVLQGHPGHYTELFRGYDLKQLAYRIGQVECLKSLQEKD